MTVNRPVSHLFQSRPTIEGAGVHLKRAFGFNEVPLLDPFLLLDDFHSDRPEYYLKGFPWHPHRGIETITYVLEGRVDHGDSLGNRGVIQPGEVQWMTAGSGIIHQEMPAGDAHDRLWGFQLWANLPADHKMMDPRYREIKAHQIPTVRFSENAEARIIAGEAQGVTGPVTDIVIGPQFLDVSVGPGAEFVLPIQPGHKALAYVIEGHGSFLGNLAEPEALVGPETLVVFGDGDQLAVATGSDPVRFLLVSGQPIGEPIAWRGPIVMNTEQELDRAFQEYRAGTFIKHA